MVQTEIMDLAKAAAVVSRVAADSCQSWSLQKFHHARTIKYTQYKLFADLQFSKPTPAHISLFDASRKLIIETATTS
jgi:hypothetical protein